MLFLSHCCQSPFPRWESQSTSPPQDYFQHCAGIWTRCTFQGTHVPVWGMYGCGKDCLIPFRLPQISCFTLSLKCFSSDSDSCPDVGIRPLLLFSHLLRAGPVLLTPLFFPSSFVLLSFAWFYTFFSSAQVLLSNSQLVFCMHFCV